MIRDFCSVTKQGSQVWVRAKKAEWFDPQVLSPAAGEDVFFDLTRFDPSRCAVCSDVRDWIDLKSFLAEVLFSPEEAMRFAHDLFETLSGVMHSQPVLVDAETIYLDPYGSQIRLLRAPLVLDCWMKREEERTALIGQLLELLPDGLWQIYGLLHDGRRRHLGFEQLAASIEETYMSLYSRFRFLRRPIPPYRAKRPVCLDASCADAAGVDALYEWMPQKRPDQIPPVLLQDGTPSSTCFALEDPASAPSLEGCLDLNIDTAGPVEPTCLLQPASTACLCDRDQRIVLDGERILLGRGADCDIQLQESSVSSVHALIEHENGRWYLRDRKSTNGTWLDGRRVSRRMRLKEGMSVRFGLWEATFHE